jgi:hypothetical protein
MRVRKLDEEFLSGWKDRKDLDHEHYATIGNIGKVAGPTREEIDNKARQFGLMKEIWDKTAKVAKIKKLLDSSVVNEDKLKEQLKITSNQLEALERRNIHIPRSITPDAFASTRTEPISAERP